MSKDQQKHNRLAHNRILVIGGSSGLGYSAVEALVESSVAHITISSSNPKRIDAAITKLKETYPSSLNSSITPPIFLDGHACDLSDTSKLEENVLRLLKFATKDGEAKLDHIIHSAGDPHLSQPLADVTVESAIQSHVVRYLSAIILAKHATAYMNPGPKSSITLTTGLVSQRPIEGWAVAGGVAAGLHGLVRGFSLDLKPIRVNGISPGFVDNEFWDGMDSGEKERLMGNIKEKNLTGRIATGEDVAEAYLYVLKDWNCTGEIISTNSGQLQVG